MFASVSLAKQITMQLRGPVAKWDGSTTGMDRGTK